MIVLSPTSLADACGLLARHGPSVVPLSGATDLCVHLPARLNAHDKTYLDLTRLVELKQIDWGHGWLRLGAGVTYWQTLCDARAGQELPLLRQAARQVGAVQIQSRGTWAGNIANGSPAADGVPVLMAYDAEVELASVRGLRRVPLRDYFTGYKQSVRKPDELIAAVHVPLRAYDHQQFHKVGARRAQAITKIGLAIVREQPGGVWRIVASSMAPTVKRCPAIESLLTSGVTISSPAGFAAAIAQDVCPIDDIRSTAGYRREVMARVLYHALLGVCGSVI